MTPAPDACAIDDCGNPVASGGLCAGHLKRRQRGMPLHAALLPRPTGLERLSEAALRYADAGDDDGEYTRARDNLRKAAMTLQTAALVSEWTREAMAKLKASGVHVGRPRKLDERALLAALSRYSSQKQLAAALGVSTRTVRRMLRTRTKGPPSVRPGSESPEMSRTRSRAGARL